MLTSAPALALALLLPTRLAAVPPPEGPRVFLLNPSRLVAAKAAIGRKDPAVMPAWDALKADADKALTVTRVSVVDKGRLRVLSGSALNRLRRLGPTSPA